MRTGRSPVHQAAVSTKLAAAALLATSAAIADSLLAISVIAAVIAAIYGLAAIESQVLLRHFRPFAWLALIALLLGRGEGGTTLLAVGAWRYTSADATAGAVAAIRLMLLVAAASWVTLSTPPTQLAHGVARALLPLQRLGVPTADLALVVMIALRFVPVLTAEAQRLQLAQAARGVGVIGGWWGALRRGASLVIPMLAAVFRRADNLADALVIRGYRAGVYQPARAEAPAKGGWLLLLAAFLAFGACFL